MLVRDEGVSAALLSVQARRTNGSLGSCNTSPEVHNTPISLELLFFLGLLVSLQALGFTYARRAERFLNAVSCSAKDREASTACTLDPNY